MRDYVGLPWLNAMVASSTDVVRRNIVCACLQCGVSHPTEPTYRLLVGLVQWLTCDVQRLPNADETHADLRTFKVLLANERTRMPPSALPYFVSMPSAMAFYTEQRPAYERAWGTQEPPTGVQELPGGRSLQLLHYLTSGVPLRNTSSRLSANVRTAHAAPPPAAVPQDLGQLGQLLLGLLQGAQAQGSAATRLQISGSSRAAPLPPSTPLALTPSASGSPAPLAAAEQVQAGAPAPPAEAGAPAPLAAEEQVQA